VKPNRIPVSMMYCGIPTFRAPTGILKVVANFAAKFKTMEPILLIWGN